eukprot:sb/3475480/
MVPFVLYCLVLILSLNCSYTVSISDSIQSNVGSENTTKSVTDSATNSATATNAIRDYSTATTPPRQICDSSKITTIGNGLTIAFLQDGQQSDPDLPGKTVSLEHHGKSGSDCIINFLTVTQSYRFM